MNNDQSENPAKVSEPLPDYKKRNLRFYSSFEEMNNADDDEMAMMSGLEQLKNATAFIKRLYKNELNRPSVYKISFR